MPEMSFTEFELRAAEAAIRNACPGAGSFTAKVAAKAALEAVARVRNGIVRAALVDEGTRPTLDPDVKGTIGEPFT